ncbi:acyl-CoA carboxylase subunit epsilon [Streptomyces sp. XD-27]|uniref:acyl-CoA carboxylase subunit epsilon n=1 Tax=Streptomyces sp. XD-27 TaxID=3062779 RepID=UPI0026F45782|nr:acyl-CoA carboxylase subunit epsilon [Streptomyces sp. XD-27]WKX72798.1 acyl-CoA carboxylase subunit epsilon [Streptomyces sp. XD-27]
MSTLSDPATGTLVRVEKGHADAEELAAVTAVLLARAASARQGAHGVRPVRRNTAGWRRLERQSGFRAPHSWQG